MKKILAIFMALILLFVAVGCNKADGEGEESETLKGEELLAGKSAKDVYNAAIEYIKALENYEIDIESNYKTTYEGEVSEENAFTTHKCSGDTFEYKYTAENYDEFFLHDGTALYKKVNSIAEKIEVSYSEFMEEWGSITADGMLMVLEDAKLEKKLFIPDGDNYYLSFLITSDEYTELTGGSVEGPVAYKVYFDKEGNVVSFERSMTYYYYDVVLVEDHIKVSIKNVGKIEKFSAPEYADLYVVRPSADKIDTSSIESLDIFEAEPASEETDYVLLNMKVEGSVKISETETVENYEGKIVIRLFPDVAPGTVTNFKKLVGTSFYKGLTIHRVIKDFVIQGGDPNGDGTGGSDEDIFGEFSSNGFTNNLSHKRGVVSMARSDDPDSASSQFFICHGDASESLDDKYAGFGYVVYGMDTVDVIAGLETDDSDKPTVKVTIESATFLKKKA